MTSRTSTGGRHRRRAERATAVSAVPVAIALVCGTGVAHADPQDFVTAPDTAQASATDAAPAPTKDRQFLPGYVPSPRVQQAQWRSLADFEAGNTQSSTVPTAPTPSPEPVIPTVQRKVIAPIDAPEGTILIGGTAVPYNPTQIDPTLVRQFNNTAAALQADGGNALVDAGLADVPQADRISAGAATGVVAGAAALGVPAAVAGAVGGGLIGLGVGAAVNPATYILPGIGWVFGPGLGAAIGAGAGAAVVGGTAAVIGGVVGGVAGATTAGGELRTMTVPAPPVPPAPVPLPTAPPAPAISLPTVDAAAVRTAVDTASAEARRAAAQAPTVVDQVFAPVEAQPQTAPVRAAVDSLIANAAPAIDQGISAVNDALRTLNI